jgi:hypothetical protein
MFPITPHRPVPDRPSPNPRWSLSTCIAVLIVATVPIRVALEHRPQRRNGLKTPRIRSSKGSNLREGDTRVVGLAAGLALDAAGDTAGRLAGEADGVLETGPRRREGRRWQRRSSCLFLFSLVGRGRRFEPMVRRLEVVEFGGEFGGPVSLDNEMLLLSGGGLRDSASITRRQGASHTERVAGDEGSLVWDVFDRAERC